MLRRSEKWAIALASVLIISMVIIKPSPTMHRSMNQQQHPPSVAHEAIDHLQAEDIALSTNLMLHSFTASLENWTTEDQLDHKLEDEVNNHPYIRSIAVLNEAGQVLESAGKTMDISSLPTFSTTYNALQYSHPYQEDNDAYVMVKKTLDQNKTMVGEINLGFIQSYLSEHAMIADSEGTLFMSGGEASVDFNQETQLPDGQQAITVPGLNWSIYVNSKTKSQSNPIVSQEVIVKLDPNVQPTEWATTNHHTILKENDPYLVLKTTGDEDDYIQTLHRDPDVIFAEHNYSFVNKALISQAKVEPNDEFFKPYQWNLEQIDLEEGWNYANGEDTIIAIIDSGVDPEHPDLQNKLVEGYNAIDDSSNFNDDNGHGTHVAGIAAALTNNVEGIAGVSWQSKIMPIKVLDTNGEGSSFSVARGIYWAVENGADVINMSLGDYYHSDVLYDAVEHAYNQGVTLISASGNENTDEQMYPAAYPQVVTVASVNQDKNRSFFSNYGEYVDVTAPGEHIPSTYLENQYILLSGTSMAAPHVAGLAALIHSINPSLSNEDIGNLILGNANQLGDGDYNVYYGYGEIDVNDTLSAIE
ncbi:S8 family serine peptidase [Alkalihalobacillus sp. LMS6]|uniref:S8 family peptidase n=1 Tax=Alkalihalobacillus sp. LMS6 TaxID=2924034 RepID=UPI0020D16024|nr:S8 family serine peptidase [Alkalihalobacillus sp. LMS6]UTR08022.1 S8 family serine peptidase [Alkalihalobacillus sp. LMS6]